MEIIQKTPACSLRSNEGYPQTENLEFVSYEGETYIKFDGLPYDIRTYVQSKSGYNQDKMVALTSECRCGTAFYYPENDFYLLFEGYN